MEQSEILKNLNLDDKQAKTYLALLGLGSGTVAEIAKKAGLKRPTTYLILEELSQRNFITQTSRKGVIAYSVEPPHRLLDDITSRQQGIKAVLPYLEQLFREQTGKPTIKLYEGFESMKNLYKHIHQQKEIYFWGSVSELESEMAEALPFFEAIIKKNKPIVYDLLESSPKNSKYITRIKRCNNPNYHIRYLPKDMKFHIDCAMVENTVYFFSFKPEAITVVIESKHITDALRTLLLLAWQSATPALN